MDEVVRVLLIDDDEDDFFLTRDLLADIPSPKFVLDWQPEYEGALASLASAQHDVYLVDYRLGRHSGLDLLRQAKAGAYALTAPIIMLTGQGEQEVDFAAMQAGAADYLVKADLTSEGLERSIRYALQQKRHEVELERRVQERTAEVARLLEAEKRSAARLRRLTGLALQINAAPSPEAVLRIVTEEARGLIPAHQALSITVEPGAEGEGRCRESSGTSSGPARLAGPTPSPARLAGPTPLSLSAASFSNRYAAWRDSWQPPDGFADNAEPELYRLVCASNHPVRLTQEELDAHPGWRALGASGRPPLRGWLAAPFLAADGRNMGLIELSDREEGDFTEEDEVILVQLALLASVAIQNTRLVAALRETDARKDEFLAMLAHELRNPLAAIGNTVTLIRLRSPADEESARSWDIVERQAEHLVRLVDDLLDVSRITRGKITLQKEHADLASVVARAVESSRPLIAERGHELKVELPEGPLPVEVDVVRLAQVLLNLLNNAAKYTPEGGKITLKVQRHGEEVAVRVRDTGVGIPREMLGKIFDLFTQVERNLDWRRGGLGIGLTLVRRLAEMHGGRVEAFSEGPGQGTEMVVHLPLSAAGPPSATETASRLGLSDAPVAGRRILVVDDNTDAAESLAQVLRLLGNEVRTAPDGDRALAEAPVFRPDLVLLDIGLPGKNGYEVAREMRALPELADTALVALTGFGTSEDRRRSREAGFVAHLVKPLDLDTLQRVLAQPSLQGQPVS